MSEESQFKMVEGDEISPAEIQHRKDDIWQGNELLESYNYFTYVFRSGGVNITARTYINEIHSVALYGPMLDGDPNQRAEAPEFREAVLAYLKRRFRKIEVLGSAGYETIWRQK